jgi:polyribonucleotide 5'-hydroxyl-kinase
MLIPVTSLPTSQYSSSSTTQPQLTSIHLALERTRLLARRFGKGVSNEEGVERGPRIMVVGPPSSGKSSVVKALTNMALGTGMGWTPTIVGLDPSSVSFAARIHAIS